MPDTDAPQLPARPDAVARLLLAEAPDDAETACVIDADPALDDLAAQRWPGVRRYRDRLDAGPSDADDLDGLLGLLDGVDLVLLELPASLGALEEYAQLIAVHASARVRLVAAGRVKHMTRTQNSVLARAFTDVRAGLGVGKCRPLHASGPRPGEPTWPRTAVEPTTGLTLVAHGSTFAGPRLDGGTRLLLTTARDWRAGEAIDVGCGNGVLSATLAASGRRTTAVDVSRSAVRSTRGTLERNGLEADVRLGDGLSGLPDGSADLVVTNPPFHVRTAKDSTPALTLIEDAPRVLRPGGELWCVFNSHLPYLRAAARSFGRVGGGAQVVVRDRDFTVLRASRP